MGCINSKTKLHGGGDTNPSVASQFIATPLSHEEFVELSTRGFRRQRRTSYVSRSRETSLHENEDVAVRENHWPAWILKFSAQDTIGWYPRKIGTYQKIEKIGQGTYSTVYKGVDLVTRQPVALKKVHAEVLDEDSVTFLMREVTLLRGIDHPNVLKLIDVASSSEKQTIFLVFEYLEHDLAGLVTLKDRSLPVSQIKFFMRQLLHALAHCHERNIMHRDVKCSNLLVDADGNLKLGDFGLAIKPHIVDQPLTNRVITLWYRPPELLLGSTRYDFHVDLWSVGCIFAELLHGKPILPGTTEVEQLHQIFKLCGTQGLEALNREVKVPYAPMMNSAKYPRKVSERFAHFPEDALEVITKLLSIVPSARGTAHEALAMPFFTGGEVEERMDLSNIPLSHEYVVKRLQHALASEAKVEAEQNNAENNCRMSIEQKTLGASKLDSLGQSKLKHTGSHKAQTSTVSAQGPGMPANAAELRKMRKRRATMVTEQLPVMPKLLQSEDQAEAKDLDLGNGRLVTSLREGGRVVGASLMKGTFADQKLFNLKHNGELQQLGNRQMPGRPNRVPRISTSVIPSFRNPNGG